MTYYRKAQAWLHSFAKVTTPSLTGRAGGGSLLLLLLLAACTSRPTSVPTSFTEVTDSVAIYPDYRDVTVPPNIAPLNFMLTDAGAKEYVAKIGDLVCGAVKDGKFDIDSVAWRQLLTGSKGKDVTVDLYAHRENGWVHFPAYTFHVAEEDIDGFLSYRLIEPGYELYRQIGLYQRNLATFDEAIIYENNRSFDTDDNHCVNCHNYQAYDTDRMLFHVRAAHGGPVMVHGSEAHKIAIKHDSILGAGVYPSWHPTLPLVAFSTNKTGQVFHMLHKEKIEVLDEASDLLLYDAEKNAVHNVIRTTDHLETFPCWSPDGRRLYYCSAPMPESLRENYVSELMAMKYDSLIYDIYSMPFDPDTRTFGTPRLEVDCASMGKSASVPRVSPDGQYLLFTLGDYGQFHIWHKSADLWVKRLESKDEREEMKDNQAQPTFNSPLDLGRSTLGELSTFNFQLSTFNSPIYPLVAANADDEPDSYHSWSSNGRWIVFASRRDDGNFSRAYIAYFDRNGQAHKAFLLPQRDPEHNLLLLKSYNVPELTRSAVKVSRATLDHVVLHTEAEVATYE